MNNEFWEVWAEMTPPLWAKLDSKPMLYAMRRRIALLIAVLLSIQGVGFAPASAAVTWSQVSKFDVAYDGKTPNSLYDLQYSSVYIFDNETDNIYFYLEFAQVPTVNMFNDGLGSWGFIGLDYDLNGVPDLRLTASRITLTRDRSSVSGTIYDPINSRYLTCSVGVFTNIDDGDKWIGFKVSRSCIKLPNIFEMFGYAAYNANSSTSESYDYAPYPSMRVNLLGTSSQDPITGNTFSGSTYALPANSLNSSYKSSNFTEPPKDLSKLSEQLLPSVVTVRCLTGSGTGWSADLKLSNALTSAGFQSVVITNHHVIEDCMGTKNVTLVLSNGTSVPGKIVSWNSSNDVAGVATVTAIPSLQWIGSPPRQGWWVGVLGSPLGKSNVLTTGIISSINNLAKTFTLTAPINPGNSGGPVFDSTGRVLGLATSKNLLSSGQIAEGFGNAHGVPLLCTSIVTCELERDPWNGISKFELASTDAASVAKAEAEAKAKAEAEAKAKAEAEAKAKADLVTTKEKTDLCIQHNSDIKLVVYSLTTAKTLYPASELLLQGIIDNAPESIDCSYIDVETFDAELRGEKSLLKAFDAIAKSTIASAQSLSKKKVTITCVKGKLTKKVTAINPKCPSGYKKK
jgi:S1-C subfamily serine protease